MSEKSDGIKITETMDAGLVKIRQSVRLVVTDRDGKVVQVYDGRER